MIILNLHEIVCVYVRENTQLAGVSYFSVLVLLGLNGSC